ncbi:MAG: hypothetical protein Alpg2KO_27880 [Alphaproteobacteria bacterium]
MRQIKRANRGVTASGYGLIVGLISVLALGVITTTGSSVSGLFDTTATTLGGVIEEEGGQAGASPSATPASSPGFNFSSHEFRSCGATGRTGPSLSDCQGFYSTSWHGDTNNFNVTGGIQYFTVPHDGTYRILATGAQGGSSCGGRGVQVQADFILTRGDVLKILVGQPGRSHNNNSSGGGGGSFVATSTDVPLIVAGGGAGGMNCPANGGDDAVYTENSSQGLNYGIALGGRLYNRGDLNSGHGCAGSGFSGDGEQGGCSTGSKSFENGGTGANGGYEDGGFGGGGAYHNSGSNVGGGGGGYTGGHGHHGYDTHPAGGGGSYVDGGATNRVNVGFNSGEGRVLISLQ